MNNREEVKEIVRKVDALITDAYQNDDKTTITADLLEDILKVLIVDYNIKKGEL